VLVLPEKPATRTKGGIWIPEVAQVAIARGTVVAIGPGRWEETGKWVDGEFISDGLTQLRPVDVKVGDRVIYHPQSNGLDDVEHDGETCKIIGEWDIVGIIDGITLTPLHDRLLVRPDPPKKASELIWLPHEVGAARSRTGKIVAAGPGMKVCGRGFVRYGSDVYVYHGPQDDLGYNRYPMPDVVLGAHVVYQTWATNQIEIDGKKYDCIRDTQVLGELMKEKVDAEK
jgi:chaperonin GroES